MMMKNGWLCFCVMMFSMAFFGTFRAQAQSQKAVIINQGALVYTEADFDAPVLTELSAGQIFNISLKQKGPFYKIRIKKGVVGWIADNDLRVAKGGKLPPLKAADKEKTPEAKEEKNRFPEKKRVRSFYASRYRGPLFSYLTYSEKTMGKERHHNMNFVGARVAGPNTMFSGDLRTDAEFLFHSGAPDYYQKYTGYPASGWIFITDFIFETASPQSKWHMTTFGFGPMFKYTHYQTSLLQNGREVAYSLDDMTLGAVFDVGLHFRILETYALRFNVKYYWEKTQYWGGALTFGFPF